MLRRPHRIVLLLALTGLTLVAACTAPPPYRPYTTIQSPARFRPHQTTVRCGPEREALSGAQKSALFQDFDSWQRAHQDPADPAPRSLPPPGPEQRAAALQACRARSS